MKKVSIIILPCSLEYSEVIQTIMDTQTYGDIEWILPKDGDRLCDEINISTGEYILLLDPWFIWAPNTTELLVNLMDTADGDIGGIIELRDPDSRKYHSKDTMLPPSIYRGEILRGKVSECARLYETGLPLVDKYEKQLLKHTDNLTIDGWVNRPASQKRKIEVMQWLLFLLSRFDVCKEAGGNNIFLQDIINLCDLTEGDDRYSICQQVLKSLLSVNAIEKSSLNRAKKRLGLWMPPIINEIVRLNAEGFSVLILKKATGETAIFSGLMHAYREKYDKKIALIMIETDRPGLEIMENCPFVDRIYKIDADTMFYFAKYPDLYSKHDVKNLTLMYKGYMGLKPRNIREATCSSLGISFDVFPKFFYLEPENARNVRDFFDSNGLIKGKTVYIVPDAVALGKEIVPDDFWEKCVEFIKEKGLGVVINSKEEIISGIPTVFMGTRDTMEMIRLCGYVIGVRTGLLDLVCAFTDAKVLGIYPNELNSLWKNNPELLPEEVREKGKCAEAAFKFSSMKSIFQRDNITELICPINISDIFSDIGIFLDS